MLRFDVETISKATSMSLPSCVLGLRFDVETISKATPEEVEITRTSCGLM